jgi:hypothetical protein
MPTNPEQTDIESPLDIIFGNIDNSKYAFLYTTKSVYLQDDLNSVEHQVHYNYLYDNYHNSCIATSVSLNNTQIVGRYDTTNLSFDGVSYHKWQVDGGTCIDNFTDSILSINTFEIVSPLPTSQELYKKSGFNINYSAISNIDSIIVFVKLNKYHSSIIDTNYYYLAEVPMNYLITQNTGSIFLSSSFLQTFPTNCYITVELITYRKKQGSINNKPYIVACIISSRTDYLLK